MSGAPDDGRTLENAAPMERRGFLRWLSGLGSAAIAALVGIPAVRAFVSPALAQPRVDNWIKVADDIALLDVGVPMRVNFVQSATDAWMESRTLNGVWLYTEDGEKFKAYNGHCTHLGCSYVLRQGARRTSSAPAIAGSST